MEKKEQNKENASLAPPERSLCEYYLININKFETEKKKNPKTGFVTRKMFKLSSNKTQ